MGRRLRIDVFGRRRFPYGKSQSLATTGLVSLATSSTLVAGFGLTQIVNDQGNVDLWISGNIRSGTTPTAGTFIEVWLVPAIDDSRWPDVFTGAEKAFTSTTRNMVLSYGNIATIPVDTNTTGRDYPFGRMARDALNATVLPPKMQIFVVHSSAVNLNATVGTHYVSVTPVFEQLGSPVVEQGYWGSGGVS